MAGRPPLAVSSRENPWFKRFAHAARDHDEEIIIEGPKSIRDAIGRGLDPLALAGVAEATTLGDITPSIVFTPRLFREISDVATAQGLVALFRRPETSVDSLFAGDGLLIALDGVQDPGNVGTIVRLAAAFDAGGVVLLEGCADPFGPKSLRASAGAALLVPIVRTDHQVLLETVLRHKFDLYAASPSGQDGHPVPSQRAVIVLGSEGNGVSEVITARARSLTILMSPRIESMNVASAAAILLARSFEKRTG